MFRERERESCVIVGYAICNRFKTERGRKREIERESEREGKREGEKERERAIQIAIYKGNLNGTWKL